MTRLHSWNAYESELTSGIDDSVLTFTVVSAAGLTAPCWLAIDPESSGNREYVRVTDIATNTLTVAARGEEGSANAPLGSVHAGGAKVRAVPVHQWLDELWDDITQNESDLGGHESAPDPHPVYLTEVEGTGLFLKLDGTNGPMTGSIDMDGAHKVINLVDGTATSQDASTVAQMEVADAAVLASANSYSDGLDHDHATPIGVHDAAAGSHGAKDDANPHNHDRYTDAEAQALVNAADHDHATPIAAHASDDDAHHAKYTDGEADARIALANLSDLATQAHSELTAVGTDDHHTKYTDGEAIAAVDNGTYLKLSGGTLTGDLAVGGELAVTEAGQDYNKALARNVYINDAEPAAGVKGSIWISPVFGTLAYSTGAAWVVAITGV